MAKKKKVSTVVEQIKKITTKKQVEKKTEFLGFFPKKEKQLGIIK